MITIDYFGVQGTGKTVTEAKKNAGSKIEQLTRQSTAVFAHKGHTLLCWPIAGGAYYTITAPDAEGRIYSCCSVADMQEAIDSGIKHLLTNTRNIGEYDVPDFAKKYERELVQLWKENDRFQTKYREAQSLGLPQQECHSYACSA